MRRRRLTEREWEAIKTALGFVLAGEDPWEGEVENGKGDGPSPTWLACQSAYRKL